MPGQQKTYYRQLRIDPLSAGSAGELFDALLGRDAGLDPLKRLLIERTEANPLYLEEGVRSLVETGALEGERGAYRLTIPARAGHSGRAHIVTRSGRFWGRAALCCAR
jgi:predicted ATPase